MKLLFLPNVKIMAAVVAGLLGLNGSVGAVEIFSNPLIDPFAGYASNDPIVGSTSQEMADDFTLYSTETIKNIGWWGNFSDNRVEIQGGETVNFAVRIFDDIGDGSSPVNSQPLISYDITAVAEITGQYTSGDSRELFYYNTNISSTTLDAGKYWLSIVENDASTSQYAWEWTSTELNSGATNVRRSLEQTALTNIYDWTPVSGSSGSNGNRQNRPFVLDDSWVSPDIDLSGATAQLEYLWDGDQGKGRGGLPPGLTPFKGTIEVSSFDLGGNDYATLQWAYDEIDLSLLRISEETLRLFWYDEANNMWIEAGEASNNTPNGGQFVLGGPTTNLGDWGLDIENNFAWANIDHASEYALVGLSLTAVPEPTSTALLALGGLAVMMRRRRQEQDLTSSRQDRR